MTESQPAQVRATHTRAQGFAAVDRTVVPDHDHGTAEVPKQVPLERADLRLAKVVREELEVLTCARAPRSSSFARRGI
jgi:hypothetical protein